MNRLLAFVLLSAAVYGQNLLQIRVIEGEGIVYPTGGRATRGITVQVTDETGRPVQGAAVTFRLPDNGPSGAFVEGGRTAIEVTAADGRALVWGMQWNNEAGPIQVRITASKGEARAGIVTSLYLSDAAAEEPAPESGAMGRKSHKKLWIALGAAAAAVGVVAASANGGTTNGAAAPPGAINAPQIGSPTIVIGRP